MRSIAKGLLVLSVLAAPAHAASTDCKMTGWVDSGNGGRPIWKCPDTK